MLEVHHRILASSHDPPWDTDDYRSLGHTPDDDGVGADPGVVTHYYGSEQDRGPSFLRLANALSALYPRGSEEKRLLDAMLLAVPR